ncbi:hypothetical protein [Dokdonella sp.]|uniref:hypothetical protein n=1 Tax=Dokdonella sp. TaxID=2291710 RepID=UPI0037832917
MRLIPSLALTLLVAATAASAQTPPPTLEERMSQAEFHAAGLDKLSADELAQLNAWLGAHGGATTKYVTASGAPVFYPDSVEREAIETHLVGTFDGWKGHTVFTLDNGQQWQQAESGSFSFRATDNAKVKIKPMMLGSWLMYVDTCGCSVRVNRIK